MDYKVVRMFAGKFLSALDMNGFQVTIFNVQDRDDWLFFLDLSTEAFGWPNSELGRVNDKHPVLPISFKATQKIPEVKHIIILFIIII